MSRRTQRCEPCRQKTVVLAKHKNRNTGSDQTTIEIRELDRSEPDLALFEIPTDYK